MPPIVVCSVTGRSLPVLEASVKTYCPDVQFISFMVPRTTFGESYNKAMSEVFKEHDEIIICGDDTVLTPTTYKYLIEDVAALKAVYGDKLGIVGSHSDSAAWRQNIRYQNGEGNSIDRYYGKWNWELQCRESDIVAPIFCWISKKAFRDAQFPPTNWYSDDVICLDLNKKGYKNFISKSYVHHVGAQTVGQDFSKLNEEAMGWLCKNRPDYARMWFGDQAVEEQRAKMDTEIEVEYSVIEPVKKHLKICVYAISKNEAQFVKRWADSARDADFLLVADTGSTDNTVDECIKNGVDVHEICITPWRFDHARNASIALIPKDIDVCVSLDLDEVLEPGWREEIERVWSDDTTRLRYLYDWGTGLQFYYEKIHARHGYYWHHPCHEYPRPDNRITENWAHTSKLLVTHHPDPLKSRGQYLDLLELSVKEDPKCPRNAFYYARELSFYSRWEDAIKALERYLAMPEATWKDERSYAMRVMAKCYEGINQPWVAETWLYKAAAEAPNTREPWCAMAQTYYNAHRWLDCYAAAMRALSINNRELVYTSDPAAWGYQPHDFAAIAAYRLGLKDVALEQGQKALDLAPNDERLQDNLLWYKGEKAT